MSDYQLSINYEYNPPPENFDKSGLQRIKRLERLRERRFHDSRTVRKIGLNGDFSYLDEYGKRMESDVATLKEIKKSREERATSPIPRALSPLPPLYNISPDKSSNTRQNLFFGNEAYTKTRMEELRRMREENGHANFTASEGLTSAVDHLQQVNERLGVLRLKSSTLQKEIQQKQVNAVVSIEEENSSDSLTIPNITINEEETKNFEE